jgi:hypothetical protein
MKVTRNSHKGRKNAFHDLASMADRIHENKEAYADMASRVFVGMR